MTRSRIWTLGTAAVVIVILAAGWFLAVAPKRADVQSVKEQTLSQQEANVQLASKIEQLKVDAQDLPAQEAKLAKFRQHVPVQPSLPSFIRDLTAIADKSSVVLVSMEPQTPASLNVTATVPVPAASTDASGEGAPTTVNSTVPSGVMFVQAQLTLSGGYFNTEQFITKLEGLKRSFLVTGFDLTADQDPKATPGDVETHLQVRVFYAPTVGTAPASSTTAPAAS